MVIFPHKEKNSSVMFVWRRMQGALGTPPRLIFFDRPFCPDFAIGASVGQGSKTDSWIRTWFCLSICTWMNPRIQPWFCSYL